MNNYDIIVVGAGAAGLIAAGRAAENGKKVLLLEKMDRAGRKLRITGKGRCNLTNECSQNEFIDHFGKAGKFLRQAFAKFFVPELLSFFKKLGVKTIVERGNRIFPESQNAADVVQALMKYNKQNGVCIEYKSAVNKILIDDDCVRGVELSDGEQLVAEQVIITTGGASYPGTGSTGDGYKFASSAGHKIINPRPALVPLETAGRTAQELQGLSLKNVTASVWVDGKKKASDFGEMIFTHFGLSGPIILTLSRLIVDSLDSNSEVVISIDMKPKLDDKKLDERLQREIKEHGKKQVSTFMKQLLPMKLIPVCLKILSINPDKLVHQINAAERKKIRLFLKNFEFKIAGYRTFREAIVTAGGIKLSEVDPRTMQSRKVNNLYFAGELLDLDGDTGGYNLQAAFSTGWLAGESASKDE